MIDKSIEDVAEQPHPKTFIFCAIACSGLPKVTSESIGFHWMILAILFRAQTTPTN